ncbi:MAG: tRNA guanosine(34) transglycosylase Tgt [Chloroflexi bacterium]|nr:tRNA guanosine(34) transglycosylase Tgt [Chloroflexota bacterium]
MATNSFDIITKCSDSNARIGRLHLAHGTVDTPVFLPVGSQATVKTLTPEELKTLGYQMILCNAYHLYLRPGVEVVSQQGSLHRFMGWNGAILTDSGGYQLYSLSPLRKIDDEGVTFRSHIDGSQHFITPEMAVGYQQALGADIIMVLDECIDIEADAKKVAAAVERTTRWAERCLKVHDKPNQLLYAIVQGGLDTAMRRRSVEQLCVLDFPGYALGGLSLGETKDRMLEIVAETAAVLPPEKPRYLMGVGSPEDIINAVLQGVDIFDSALPTRVARNGALYTAGGRINITNAAYIKKDGPVEEGCSCYTCRNFSAAYLNHLFRAQELLAYRLATIHNLHFMNNFMKNIKEALGQGNLSAFASSFLGEYRITDQKARIEQKQNWQKRNRSL